MQRALAPRPAHLQHRARHALADADDNPLFALRPDAVIEAPGGPIVLDTKWKSLTPREPRCEKTLGVAASDVYQMLAYARAYDAKRLVLLYPWHREIEREGITRKWRVNDPESVTATDRRPDIAAVDVGCPDGVVETLRGIVCARAL